eukprot:m.6919 g.6919  ORF g.6919 m.6919 type:complete len:640 (+) comp2680_c0_seq2:99-2018(+)
MAGKRYSGPALVVVSLLAALVGKTAANRFYSAVIFDSLSTPNEVVVYGSGIPGHKWRTFLANETCSGDAIGTFQNIHTLEVTGVAVYRCVFDGSLETKALSATIQSVRCEHPPAEERARLYNKPLTLRWNDQVIDTEAVYRTPIEPPQTAPGEPKQHHICASLILQTKADFLNEWLRFHTQIGLDHTFVYDERSTDSLQETVAHLSNGYSLEYIPWHHESSQPAMMTDASLRAQGICEWLLLTDIDEFVMLYTSRAQGSMDTWLAQFEAPGSKVGGLELKSYTFTPGDHGPIVRKPDGGVIKNYICRRTFLGAPGKTIARVDALHPARISNVHSHGYRDGFHKASVGPRDVPLFHYKFQAWEVFMTKNKARASPTGKLFVFDSLDPNKPDQSYLTDIVWCNENNTDCYDRQFCENSYRLAYTPCPSENPSDIKEVLLLTTAGFGTGVDHMVEVIRALLPHEQQDEITADWTMAFRKKGSGPSPRRFRRIVQHVRHPLAAIAAAAQISEAEWDFIVQATPEVDRTAPTLVRALRHWVSWNNLIELFADWRYLVEEVHPAEMCHGALANLIKCSHEAHVDTHPHHPKNRVIPSSPDTPTVDWSELMLVDPDTSKLAIELAIRYGYKVPAEYLPSASENEAQ